MGMSFCPTLGQCGDSRKKRKDGVEGSLSGVLSATELEFRKILVPRLPHNSSNVNNE